APASPARSDRADCRACVSTWSLPKGMIEGHGWNPRVIQSAARQRMHDIRAHQPGRLEVPPQSRHGDDTRDCLVRAGETNCLDINERRIRRNSLREAADASETMPDQLANQRQTARGGEDAGGAVVKAVRQTASGETKIAVKARPLVTHRRDH